MINFSSSSKPYRFTHELSGLNILALSDVFPLHFENPYLKASQPFIEFAYPKICATSQRVIG